MVKHDVAVEGHLAITGSQVTMTVERGAESWQFFAFVFAALVTLVLTLADEIPSQKWRVAAKVLGFLGLAYVTLINGRLRNWLVGLLRVFKRLERR